MTDPLVGLPDFDYIKPRTLVEASAFLAAHAGESRPLLGGTDIFVRMRGRQWTDKYLVDIKGLQGMEAIGYDPVAGLTMGAAVNMNQVIASPLIQEHYPILAEAAHWVASYQLRTRATVVGNICNASPAGDTTGACLVLGSVLRVHGVNGERDEPLATFFRGPGQTVLKAGDIVTTIRFPPPPPGSVGRYLKLGRNALGDLAIVGVAALGYRDRAAASGLRFRLALASVAPMPLIPSEAERLLADKAINPAVIQSAAEAAMQVCTPIDDSRGSARYRRLMIRNLTRQAITEIWERIR
jgi:aerobic carbon-monoxide dehydrogenase medium subunit